MKKGFITICLICAALIGSAQITMVSTIDAPSDNEGWELSNFTKKIGFGYSLNDNTMIGAVKNGEDYDVFARHNMGFGFLCLDAPTEDMIDNMQIGYGMNVSIINNLYFTPRYMISLKDGDNRDGKFSIGLTYNL
tara:strand:- start:1138 stop:1542 length:405 start_codon:yes stop_codon:yes gene_type:complete